MHCASHQSCLQMLWLPTLGKKSSWNLESVRPTFWQCYLEKYHQKIIDLLEIEFMPFCRFKLILLISECAFIVLQRNVDLWWYCPLRFSAVFGPPLSTTVRHHPLLLNSRYSVHRYQNKNIIYSLKLDCLYSIISLHTPRKKKMIKKIINIKTETIKLLPAYPLLNVFELHGCQWTR